MKLQHKTLGSRIFDVCNYSFIGIWGMIAVLPFFYIVSASFAPESQLSTGELFLFPEKFTLDAYKYIFSTNSLLKSLGNSVYITIMGTLINLIFTTTMAYSLSRKELYGRKFFMNMIIFTMLFGGGMIPTYLVVKGLGLLDSYWSLMLPIAISPFNLIVVKNFFQELPVELTEAAKIEGCNDLGVFWKIVLPLSLPVLATFGLFYAVAHWNSFFTALIYINDSTKWPFQVILRQIILLSQGSIGDISNMDTTLQEVPKETVKMAIIIIGTVPILCVYPFLQKHFAKGVMVGAIKG